MTLRTGFFLVILLFSFSFFFFNTLRLIRYLRIGKPETRAGRPLERLKQVLTLAFGHSKLFREPLAGLMHFFIFWGFVVLVFAIVETIGEGLRPGFTLSLLGPLYGPLAFLEDVLGLLVILSAVVALLRRYVTKPPRLDVSGHSRLDATIILLLILLIMCAMFGQNAANIERGLQAAAERRFVSRGLAPLFNGCSAEALDGWFSFFWWTHISIVLGFLNYLPYSKHLHILSSIPNVYLAKLDPRGVLKPLNLQDEKATKFGAADVEDLTWKQLLDGYTCTECGRCTAACPAALTGKPLSPKKIVVDIRRRLMEKAPLLSGQSIRGETALPGAEPAGRASAPGQLVGDYISEDELWACTTCMACVQECPVQIEEGTMMRTIFGKGEIGVNSTHHQAIGKLAKGLKVTAKSADGIVFALQR